MSLTGKKVVILEAKIVGAGNSARHLGDLTTWKRHLYSTLFSLYDKPTISSIAKSHKYALDYVEKV